MYIFSILESHFLTRFLQIYSALTVFICYDLFKLIFVFNIYCNIFVCSIYITNVTFYKLSILFFFWFKYINNCKYVKKKEKIIYFDFLIDFYYVSCNI